ncbi:MAG: DUF2798 domain-containing protein [Acidobacteria bacterium]|nr:DUF2798 domain-containing protein [Acidobacteriota bacterium]
MDKKYSQIVLTLISSGVMALLMSGVMTIVNRGLVDGFISLWFRAFVISWLISFPASLIIIPQIKNLVEKMMVERSDEIASEITSVAA